MSKTIRSQKHLFMPWKFTDKHLAYVMTGTEKTCQATGGQYDCVCSC